LQQEFYGNCACDEEAASAIRELFEKNGYLCDTHTAVAVSVYNKYVAETGDRTPSVIASTASPYKFSPAVLSALTGKECSGDEFAVVEELSRLTSTDIPAPLAGLAGKSVLHKTCVEKEDMAQFISDFLGV
ncbi:MAG: threonine synthase, partial [Lentisphaeria bacterium]|nr:threonine synthase [Lentisphaeria bacterium]